MLIAKELIIYLLFCLSIKKSIWQKEFFNKYFIVFVLILSSGYIY